MNLVKPIALALLLASATPGLSATVRELGTAELRQVTRSGEVISLKRVIESVATAIDGEVIEARAFEADDVYYRIVLKKANGSVVSVIINARTGEQVGKNSAIGRQLVAAADGSKGNKDKKDKKDKTKSEGSRDKSTGNAGSSSGGSGSGNGGGNGGGGNGGGNGGGKN